jgi:hypothetical protein
MIWTNSVSVGAASDPVPLPRTPPELMSWAEAGKASESAHTATAAMRVIRTMV